MLNKLLCVISFLAISVNLHAQTNDLVIQDINTFYAKKFRIQTFQIKQFIDRFNFDEKIEFGNGIDISRKFNLLLLTNQRDSSLLKNQTTIDFINKVSSDSVSNRLSFLNGNWYATVNCSFIYKSKPVKILLKLKLTGDRQYGYSWTILEVESNKVFTSGKKNYKNFINPLNNEIGFTELSTALENRTDLRSYFDKNVTYNTLSAFNDYIRNGDLIFKQIDNIQYHFNNIAGYNFTVDYFMRMDMNAGWLISSITKN